MCSFYFEVRRQKRITYSKSSVTNKMATFYYTGERQLSVGRQKGEKLKNTSWKI